MRAAVRGRAAVGCGSAIRDGRVCPVRVRDREGVRRRPSACVCAGQGVAREVADTRERGRIRSRWGTRWGTGSTAVQNGQRERWSLTRFPGRRACVHGRLRDRLQPSAPTLRHRPAHPRRGPLRPGPADHDNPGPCPGCSTGGTPRTVRHERDPKILTMPAAAWINQPPETATPAKSAA